MIRIALEAAGNRVCIQVINPGSTLDEKNIESLFQQMVSYRKSSGDKPHLGFGLFVVRLIAEYHDGSVTAYNLPDGEGVCFSVELPK